jgi:SAM-dependent methyltransferase
MRQQTLYQNIELPESVPVTNRARADSKFWSNGKWDTFIVPLLPLKEECEEMTFIEVGCNAGLYLKRAKEWGFKNVIGVECDEFALSYANKYRDHLGYDYKLLKRTVGTTFSFDELPVADYVLLSNFHYHLGINVWVDFLDRLQYKTRNCIVVSCQLRRNLESKASGEYEAIKNNFKSWEEIKSVTNVPTKGDSSPRKVWSLLFKSKLQRRSLDEFIPPIEQASAMFRYAFGLAQDVVRRSHVHLRHTKYYGYLKKRKGIRWTPNRVYEHTKSKVDMMYDVKNNGMKTPLFVRMYPKIRDGYHRAAILKALGYKTAITRVITEIQITLLSLGMLNWSIEA